jgi:hypothetical protein
VNPTLHRLPLLLTIGLGLVAVVRLAAGPLVRVSLDGASDTVAPAPASATHGSMAAESISAIAARDPFRVGRRPVLPAYDPLRLAEQLAPPPPRPVIAVVGILDGRPPSAVLEGLPGVEGSRVVRVGDVIGPLKIKGIDGQRVVVSGMDTTWTLEVRKPWQP